MVPGLRRPQARRRRPDNAEARRTIGVKLHNVADHSCDWQMSLKGADVADYHRLELGDTQA